jgi:SAM-dependent methyltransferase
MKILYQSQWHGINFKDFSACSSENIATEEFYDKFYKEFFNKFKNFEDLDKDWVDYKIYIAKFIEEIVENKSNILSIGCGIGIVEDYLIRQDTGVQITAIEPSKNVSKWLKKNPNIELHDGYFPQCIKKGIQFDFAYANGVDYVFNEIEYLTFLESVIDYGITDFLIISSSSYNFATRAKRFIKSVLELFGIRKKTVKGQFWGYLRSVKEQKKVLIKAGFKTIEVTKSKKNSLFIRAKV